MEVADLVLPVFAVIVTGLAGRVAGLHLTLVGRRARAFRL
jgi:hypothetical protein